MSALSVRTKIDVFLLPLLFLASNLAALDKNAMAYAAVLGMVEDLDLKGQQYSLLGSIFYFGYLLMEGPTAWILTRAPTGKYISILMLLWGFSLCMMASCTSFAGAAVIRFLLGMLEAGLMPACIVLTATWYRREEQPLRTALWYCPFSAIFGGILPYAIGRIQSDLPVWKLLFLIYGTTTIGVGIVLLLALPDHHGNAWFLDAQEADLARRRTSANQTGSSMRQSWKSRHIRDALFDAKYWVMLVFGICQSVTNAGVTNFNPLILSGFGYSKEKTVLLASPQGVVVLITQLVATVISLYIPNTRCILWVISCFPALLGVVMIQAIDPSQHPIAALIGLYLLGFYNVSWVMAMSLVSSNTAGATKKSFSSVSMAVFYAVGNTIGPQFFLDSQKPHYQLGIDALFFCFAVMAVTGVLYAMLCIRQNNARNRKSEETSPLLRPADRLEDTDPTDTGIPNFRYVY